MHRNLSLKKKNLLLLCCVAMFLICGLYFLSVFWRVSRAEQKLFGRSYLIPMSLTHPEYTEAATANSFGTKTYSFKQQGKTVRVFKQLINGFQHTYGSALVSFEIGESASDKIFRINEYLESYLGRDGKSAYFYLDTKKDLFNNALGRRIGGEARHLGLHGTEARNYIIAHVLKAMDSGEAINHYLDPRILSLPSLTQYGCPGLPCDRWDKSSGVISDSVA